MRVRFLGTGTSYGVPRLRCRCATCTSSDPRDRRRRASALVEVGDRRLLIDVGPDFRAQALDADLWKLDAVFVTHFHADHVFGLDDLRGLTDDVVEPLPVVGGPETCDELARVFPYIFTTRPYPGLANLALRRIEDGVFAEVGGFGLLPFAVPHGRGRTFGLRVGSFGYLVDCHVVPDSAIAALRGVDVLALDLLQDAPHPTHLGRAAALEAARKIGARETWFLHMCHELKHAETDATLPPGMRLAYDGLTVDVGAPRADVSPPRA
ncbi:MAG TPA: MBL fold metallo-hydrolase [Planctomycetota bacterium]|nr:MBL fold metallo-hydrolase [Planctomycetota bacterium]